MFIFVTFSIIFFLQFFYLHWQVRSNHPVGWIRSTGRQLDHTYIHPQWQSVVELVYSGECHVSALGISAPVVSAPDVSAPGVSAPGVSAQCISIFHTMMKVNLRYTLTILQLTIYYSCLTTAGMKRTRRILPPVGQICSEMHPLGDLPCHSHPSILVHVVVI